MQWSPRPRPWSAKVWKCLMGNSRNKLFMMCSEPISKKGGGGWMCVCVHVFVVCVWVFTRVWIHMLYMGVCEHVCTCIWKHTVDIGIFLNFHPFYLLRQGLSLNPGSLIPARLASQVAPGIAWVCPSTGVIGGQHTCLAFTWLLEIQTPFLCLYSKCFMHISVAPNYLIFNIHLRAREKILHPTLRYFKYAINRIVFPKILCKSCHTAT